MGCATSAPVPPAHSPQLVGTWVNTKKASWMDPDLGGTSSPVRIKPIHLGDGHYQSRWGTSPMTQLKPTKSDRETTWVRIHIHEDGRVRYEQLDHERRYYVLDFPVNSPWEKDAAELPDIHIEDRRHFEQEVKKKDVAEVRAVVAGGPTGIIRGGKAGSMEYHNCLGDTKVKIEFEYCPRVAAGEEKQADGCSLPRPPSTLRITPAGTGMSHTLVRQSVGDSLSSSSSSRNRRPSSLAGIP